MSKKPLHSLSATCQASFLIALLAVCLVGATHSVETIDDALLAYQEMQLTKARHIAEEHRATPLGRLILALCRIHDHKKQDIDAGIAGLRELYEDDSIDVKVWTQAALAYGRIVQLFQGRDLYPQFDDIDVEAVYRRILERVPDSVDACLAVTYLAEKHFLSENTADWDQAFEMVESTTFHSAVEKGIIYFAETGFLHEMERFFEEVFIRKTQMYRRFDPFGVGVFVGYVWCQFVELTNLRTIINGIAFRTGAGQIRKGIIYV